MAEENNVEEQNNTETPSTDVENNAVPAEDTTVLTQKIEGEKPVEEGSEEGKEKEQVENAPESYVDYTIPEGFSLDKDMLGNFNKVAKELNLSQDKAQKLIDVAVNHTQQINKQGHEAFHEVRKGWVSELKEDKEFGGAKYDKTIHHAQKVLQKFGSEGLNKFLVSSGAGDNGEVIKLLARIGSKISEDTVVDGAPVGAPKSAAEIIYGNNN